MAPFICKYSPISTVLLLGPKCTPSLVQLITATSFNMQRNSSDSPGATTYDSGWEIWYLVGGSAEEVGEKTEADGEEGERREGPTKVSGGRSFPGDTVLALQTASGGAHHLSPHPRSREAAPTQTLTGSPGNDGHSRSQQKLSWVGLFPRAVNRALKTNHAPE